MNTHDLLNAWQRGFPLVREPFGVIAQSSGTSASDVIGRLSAAHRDGTLSRIGGVFAAGAGGGALLCAMAVPPERLADAAAIVSAHPGVNHNYEREHRINLWFVLTGPNAPAVETSLQELERATGVPARRLAMQQAYRIDLGFDLGGRTASEAGCTARRGAPVEPGERRLAAMVEEGLPLVERPFDEWAGRLGSTWESVAASIERWLQRGTLRRFGAIVRHHELGFAANAMAVFDVQDAAADDAGRALADEPGVTLAYRRTRAADWPYNLYAMVHGRDRDAVHQVLERLCTRAGLGQAPHAVLFSRRRFKQTGARYFTEVPHALGA